MFARKAALPIGALLAVALACAPAVAPTWSYFTTQAKAAGGAELHLGSSTAIEEEFSRWTKHVTVTLDADSQPAFIRVKAFCGAGIELTYGGEDWNVGADGYWYYAPIVQPGESTGVLDIKIDGIPGDDALEMGDAFNVAVVYEYVPVSYDADGNALADWSQSLLLEFPDREEDR